MSSRSSDRASDRRAAEWRSAEAKAPDLVLASGSPRRRELLENLGLVVDVRPADIDETPEPGEDPVAYVMRLAREKAARVPFFASGLPVLAADTTVDLDGTILGKPEDDEEATTMLRSLSGRVHAVHTGVAVAHDDNSVVIAVTTEVEFAAMSDAAIEWYVASREPRGKAGAYAIQGAGGAFVRGRARQRHQRRRAALGGDARAAGRRRRHARPLAVARAAAPAPSHPDATRCPLGSVEIMPSDLAVGARAPGQERGRTSGVQAAFGAGFRRYSTYRQAAIAGAFTNTIFGAIKIGILFALARGAGGTVAGYDRSALATYTWVSQGIIAVVVLFQWTDVSERVLSGNIAVDLLRPLDPQLYWLAHDLGRAAVSVALRLVPPVVIGAVVFGISPPHQPVAYVLFPISLFLAVVVSFACRWLVSLVAFWLTQIKGVLTIYVLTTNLLSGLIVPLQIFPRWLAIVARCTPFPSILQTPVNVWTGVGGLASSIRDVGLQVAWAAVVLALGRVVFGRATRVLVVLGG